jgi:hypothetical protein
MSKKPRLKLTYFNKLQLFDTKKDLLEALNNGILLTTPLKLTQPFPLLDLDRDQIVTLDHLLSKLSRNTLVEIAYKRTRFKRYISATCRRRRLDGKWYLQ